MKPETHTVQQLFERDVRYTVPLYQRPYVWDEDHQWAPLWDDITALLHHQEGEDPSGLWTHFLGAIVLELEQTVPGQIPRFTVIDGQQRLTTLQLLLAAAASAVANVGAGERRSVAARPSHQQSAEGNGHRSTQGLAHKCEPCCVHRADVPGGAPSWARQRP